MALAVKRKGQGVRSGSRRELITASMTLSLTVYSSLSTHSHTHTNKPAQSTTGSRGTSIFLELNVKPFTAMKPVIVFVSTIEALE